MTAVSHQTIKLGRGKHSSPEDGACVMELASMLAGEPFSDHPHSVCPVIASFLRTYNDSIDDKSRQDLYAYASIVAGTRSNAQVERARAARLAAWTAELRDRRRFRVLLPPRLRRLGLTRVLALDAAGVHAAGTHAARAISRHTPDIHAQALALIEELATIGRAGERPGCRYTDHEVRPGDEHCLVNGRHRRPARQGNSDESGASHHPEQAPAGQDGRGSAVDRGGSGVQRGARDRHGQHPHPEAHDRQRGNRDRAKQRHVG